MSIAVAIALVADTVGAHWPVHCLNATLFTLSFELHDAPCALTAEDRAQLWLQRNKTAILREAHRYRIDPLAIAAAIDYEAVKDVHLASVFSLTRSSGPGKVHYKAGYFHEGMPVAKQTERLGYVSPRSLGARKRYLATPDGAIEYIGAIMRGFADTVRSTTGANISCSPSLLVGLYTELDFPAARLLFESDPQAVARLETAPASRWTKRHETALRPVVGNISPCMAP